MLSALLLSIALLVQAPSDPLYPIGGWQSPGVSLLAPMNVEPAWDVTIGDPLVLVGIVSTGSVPNDDLGSNIQPPVNVIPTGFDCNWGSRLAAIVGGAWNDTGTAGVAPATAVLPVRATGCDFTTMNINAAATAMDVARLNGAKIILVDAVLYRYAGSGWDGQGGNYPQVRAAFRACVRAGILVICPAGDFSSFRTNEDDIDLMVVGATREDDTHLGVSDRGPAIDIAAPGGARTLGDLRYSSRNAAAYVAGVAALTASTHPSLTGAQVGAILMATARDVDAPGRDIRTGVGVVNAAAAVVAP